VSESLSTIEVAHERLRPGAVRLGSDRSFGLVAGTVLTAIGMLRHFNRAALFAAAAVWICAFVWPVLLRPFHHLAFGFARLMHRVTNPVLMAILFFGAITPIGYLRRRFGTGVIAVGPEPSYWEAPRPSTSSMTTAF
jgi:hypothetical protein